MKLSIKTKKLEDNSGFIAEVDWTKFDAGKVGTPGAVKYGKTKDEAHDSLKSFLELKGHMVCAQTTTMTHGGQRPNAGRKPNTYKTKPIFIPEPLIPKVRELIKKFKENV